MTDLERAEQLRLTIHEQEKRFLMEKYVSMLMVHVEKEGAETLDDRTVESLLVSRSYVSDDLASKVARLLEEAGVEVEDVEREEEDAPTTGEGDSGGVGDTEDFDTAVEDEDFAALLDGGGAGDAGTGTAAGTKASAAAEEAEIGDRIAEGTGSTPPQDNAGDAEALGLFDEATGEKTEPGLEADAGGEDAAAAGGGDPDLAGDEGLFDDTPGGPTMDSASESAGHQAGGDAGAGGSQEAPGEIGLFDEDGDIATARVRPPAGEKAPEGDAVDESGGVSEEDEEAGVLFDHDIYSGNRGAGAPPSETASPGAADPEGADQALPKEPSGFTPTRGHEVEETPGFTPTRGHEVEETPGFTPTRGHEVEETPGFTPTRGHEVEETPGFTPVASGDDSTQRTTPGFTPTGEAMPESVVGKRPQREVPAEESAGQNRRRPPRAGTESEKDQAARRFLSAKERAERLKQAHEERRLRLRQQQQQEDPDDGDGGPDLDVLTHQISLEDIEQYMGMAVLPDDRQKLERRWQQKMRDPSIRQLLADATAMEHPYALIPRVSRFFKNGAALQLNMLNLVRNYPQLFENVAGLINKYRTQPFFVGEVPELDWAIVACEVLPASHNRNFMEQKTVIKQYAQAHQTNERRIQRRRLIEVLYDCIVINAITKEQILQNTVDLTDTKVGRQKLACVNFGDKGIRINDVSRQQRHPQMGTCPSW